MANLIASVRDNDGRILIEHFYDDVRPITAAEREAIAGIPAADSALRDELQLGASEANNALLAERIMLPALNVRGISGGNVGALAANAISTAAYASIDFRLVPGQTPEHVRELFEAHARKQGYFVTHAAPTREERFAHARILRLDWEAGYPAQRADMSLPVSRAVVRAVALGTGEPPIVLPTSGASAGLYHFDEVLHAPLISVPIANHDDNQHAANENVRLQNVFDGMQVYAAIVAHLGGLWSVIP